MSVRIPWGPVIALALAAMSTVHAWSAEVECFAKRIGDTLVLGNGGFKYQIDLSSGPRAEYVENLLTGEKIDLGRGPECGLRFSGAESRIELLDWKMMDGGPAGQSPDEETGFAKHYFGADFDDSSWPKINSPWILTYGPAGAGYAPPFAKASPNPDGYNWYRVRFDLPTVPGKPVSFGIGGCGVYDFGRQRFFLNGKMIGERNIGKQEWRDVELITLGPGDQVYESVRFGGTNVLAVQAWDQFDCRPKKLRDLDPGRHYDSARLLNIFEQFVAVGSAYQDLKITGIGMVDVVSGKGEAGLVKVELRTEPDVGKLLLVYEWTADEPALRKWLEFRNTSGSQLLLLEVDLGDHHVSVPTTEGFRGFPLYLADQVFLSVAHPAGVALGSPGRARLKHFPGKYIQPGGIFTSKQAVYGMGKAEGARQAFWDYLLRRSMRRQIETTKSTLHYDALSGAWGRSTPWGHLDPPSEKVSLQTIEKLGELRRDLGIEFDYYWWDAGWGARKPGARSTDFNEVGFPNGPGTCIERIKELGMKPGIYMSGCPQPPASPDNAPAWRDFISYQTRTNGFQGFKFDGASSVSYNQDYVNKKWMLPGKYSVEWLFDGRIAIYAHLHKEDPKAWVFGYWGHDSPWWLLHVCTTFDHGINMEMQNVSAYPTLYERDSVTLAMDQAHQYRDDMPPRGRDSLGVWMGTGWAGFGHERWLENLIMDVGRGHGLIHFWADVRKFSDEESAVLARIAKVFKENSDCFANSRTIVGNPWKCEPYGYSCSNGQRAFIAVNNPTWLDQQINVALSDSIGLQDSGRTYELYRHAPDPARMRTAPLKFGNTMSFYLRPFEVVLLEFAPAEHSNSLPGPWKDAALAVERPSPESVMPQLKFECAEDTNVVNVRGELPPCETKSVLAISLHMSKSGRHWSAQIPPIAFCLGGRVGDKDLGSTGYERNHVGTRFSPWIVYRIPLEPSDKSREVDVCLMELQPKDVKIDHEAYLIPLSK